MKPERAEMSSDEGALLQVMAMPNVPAQVKFLLAELDEHSSEKKLPRIALNALNDKTDYSMLWPKFAVWMLGDKKHGLINLPVTRKAKQAINEASDVYEMWVSSGARPVQAEWNSAGMNTYAVAHSRRAWVKNPTTYNASFAAHRAIYAAHENYESDAAEAAYYAAAANSFDKSHGDAMCDQLIRLMNPEKQ